MEGSLDMLVCNESLGIIESSSAQVPLRFIMGLSLRETDITPRYGT